MTIEVACQCGGRFAAPPHLAGKRVSCPSCGRPISVPAQQPSPKPAGSAAPGERGGVSPPVLHRPSPKPAGSAAPGERGGVSPPVLHRPSPTPAGSAAPGERGGVSPPVQQPSRKPAESVVVACRCGQRFAAPPHLAGKRIPCPSCGAPISVPAPTSVPAPKPAPSAAKPIVVACACGQKFAAPPHLAGQAVSCPACGLPIAVPAPLSAGARFSDEELTFVRPKPKAEPEEKPRRSDDDVLRDYLKEDTAKSLRSSRSQAPKNLMPVGPLIGILAGVGAGIGLAFAVALAVLVKAGDEQGPLVGAFFVLPFFFAVMLVMMGGVWRVYEKAGFPGFASVIPIYNVVVLHEIAGLSPWFMLLWLIPCLNYVAMFLLYYGIARNFGRDALYAIGLFLFGFVFFPLLGYSSDEYRGDYRF